MNRRNFVRSGALAAAVSTWAPRLSCAAFAEGIDMAEDAPAFVLIHSPLVGGSFWQPVAEELERHRRQCYAPTPPRTGDESVLRWRYWPDRLRDLLPSASRAILVGHSAAGMLLPAVAERIGARGLIFVDASIPPERGIARPVDPEFMKFVRSLPDVGGRLPRWSEWWPKNAMAALIPDEEARRRFDNDLPLLSLEWFEDSVEVPAWQHLSAGYIQTSDRFSQEAEKARSSGWPVVVLNGTHLHPMLSPLETTDAILSVAKQLGSQPGENPSPQG
jgi:Alpha/beta hydrolase family